MRKSLIVSCVVVASLALSACGSSPSAKKAAINQFVTSLGASPNVQIHLSANVTGAGTTKAAAVLKLVSMDLRVSNPSGGSVSQAKGKANYEILFNVGTKSFLDIRDVSNNIYALLNVPVLASIPSAHIPAGEAAAIQGLFGGRWFELPKSLLTGLIHKSKVPKAQVAAQQSADAKVLDAISHLIDTTPYKTLSNGYSETGTLKSVAAALAPTFSGLAGKTLHPKAPKGTYTLILTTSGSTVTGGTISITAPSSHGTGNETGSLTATVAHASMSVGVPSGVTQITPQMIAGFLTLGKG